MEPMLLTKREKRKVASQYADLCLTCGTCAGGCPVTGLDDLDVRKAVRLALLGMDQELIDSSSPGFVPFAAVANMPAPWVSTSSRCFVRPEARGKETRYPAFSTRAFRCA